MQDRVLPFEGIHNFRDYGGYACRSGARLKTGRLFRSGQHVDATSDDLTRVAALNLSTVIDLRGDSERAQFPCARPPGFNAELLFAPGETAGAGHAPHVEAAREVSTAAQAHAAMVALYKSMPFRPRLIEIFQLYFEALDQSDGPTLLHCLAGKDRTGLAVGLLHRMLGAHPDDVMADYMLTNIAGDMERRIAAGASTVRSNFGHAMDDQAVRTLMSVHPEFLETAFSEIESEHGSVEDYARERLGVSAARLAQMEMRLLD